MTLPAQFIPPDPTDRPEWSLPLVMDVALGVPEETILEAYGLAHHQFERICLTPEFALRVGQLKKDLEKEGATFRLKAQIQADTYLVRAHQMIMNPDTDSRVVTRLIEDVVRWGGLDAPAPVNGGSGGGGFQINLNFGTRPRPGLTIDMDGGDGDD